MYTVRVDGNDVFAVYNATKAAREYCLANNKPALIEAMTYRVGHHSTSDDSTRYRTAEEIERWTNSGINPIKRMKAYLERRNLWDDEKDKALWTNARKEILAAIKQAENELKPPLDDLFNDVYDVDTPNIAEQRQELAEHLAKYGDKYPLDKHRK